MNNSPTPEFNVDQVPVHRRLAPTMARIFLGLPLFVFGLNCFLNFIPQPDKPIPEKAMAFAGALMNSGYMMPLIGATLLTVGALVPG